MTKLYSSYLARLNKLPDDVLKVFVFLYKPPRFEIPLGMLHEESLAPDKETFKKYKTGALTLEEYLKEYEQVFRERLPKIMQTTVAQLASYDKVCLICYEKDINTCHRLMDCKVLNELDEFEYLGEI